MVTDPDGTIRYMSPSVERVLGYRPEEMVGTNTVEYVHPDDMEGVFGELEALLSKPGVHPVAVESRVRHKDGSWRHLEGIASNLLDDLAVEGLVFSHRDVTDRVQAEEEVRRLNEELEERVAERTARQEAALSELRNSEERYRLLVESVKDYAIFTVDPNGCIADWNEGAERLFGYKEEEIIGKPSSILFTPKDIQSGAPERELRKAEEEGKAVDERWHLRKDGSRFWSSGFVRPIRDDAGNLRGFAKVARDITERKEAEETLERQARQAALRADVGAAFSGGGVLRDVLQRCAEAVVKHLDAAFARVWTLNEKEDVLELQASAGMYTHLDGVHSRVPVGELKIGLIAQERRPHLTNTVTSDPRVSDKEWARQEGMIAFAGYPLIVEGRLVGVMAMFSRKQLAEDTIEALASVVDVIAQGIERKRVEEARARLLAQEQSIRTEVEEAQRRLAFLAEASAELSSSLDYRATLSSLARLAVPTLADWCVVDVLENGSLERLAVAHPDPEKVALAHELHERYPPDPDAPRGIYQVLRTGEPEMMQEIPEELIEQAARDAEHSEMLRELGFTSYMVVPLVVQGRTLGAIGFVTAESGRRYGDEDLKLAEELASRSALAIDNARLYGEAQREITERERAEKELSRLASFPTLNPNPIVETMVSAESTYLNPAAERLFPDLRRLGAEHPFLADLETVDREIRQSGGRPTSREVQVGNNYYHQVVSRLSDSGLLRLYAVDITERKRAEQAMAEVREAERRRIARDLHDGVLQDLSYAAQAMEVTKLQAEGTGIEEALQEEVDAIRSAAHRLRAAVHDLRLADELDQPFPRVLESLIERNREMARGQQIGLEAKAGFLSEPLGEAGTELLRILQEALTNARRHSGAKSVLVSLRGEGNDLVAEVSDDGRGFKPSTVPGVGLRSMQERAVSLGGRLEVESEPGKGTRVRLRVPMPLRV